MNIKKVRDLTLVALGQGKTMVIACDSCGGVVLKEGDTLKASPYIAGKFTVRVAMLEVLCAGADIVCVTDTVCNEMHSTGRLIIKGIEDEMAAAGISRGIITGSTEENFFTTMTGLGVTAIGIADTDRLKINHVKQEALLVALGRPKVGREVLISKSGEIAGYTLVKELFFREDVYELVPVGSGGILREAGQLAMNNNMNLILNKNVSLDLFSSAGPSTVILLAVGLTFPLDFLSGHMELIGRIKPSFS
jgi:hypothetical protein